MEEKHQNEEEEENDYSKRKKKVKKSKSGKVWSEEDEISLLRGYYEYQKQKKAKSEVANEGDVQFYDYIKPRLNCSLKQSQVSRQIHCFKKNYFLNQNSYENNKNRMDNRHLQNLFQLSKKIWSSVNKNVSALSLCPMISMVGLKFDLSNDFLSKEFNEFAYDEGVDVGFMDSERVRDLKRKFGEVEVCRSKYEFKQTKLCTKLEKLKRDHFKRALKKFC